MKLLCPSDLEPGGLRVVLFGQSDSSLAAESYWWPVVGPTLSSFSLCGESSTPRETRGHHKTRSTPLTLPPPPPLPSLNPVLWALWRHRGPYVNTARCIFQTLPFPSRFSQHCKHSGDFLEKCETWWEEPEPEPEPWRSFDPHLARYLYLLYNFSLHELLLFQFYIEQSLCNVWNITLIFLYYYLKYI